MYSVYKFIVLGACIVYMCVELSFWRLANLNFPKYLQKFAKFQNPRAPHMTRNCLATRIISHNDFALVFFEYDTYISLTVSMLSKRDVVG